MTDMMHTVGFGSGIWFIWCLHMLACLTISVGIVLLIVWAIKTLNQAQLKMWGITLAVIGALVCALTMAITPMAKFTAVKCSSENGMMMRSSGHMMGNGMMMDDDDMMMDDDDMMNMSMGDMSRMLEGKTGDDFDKAFIEGMIPHHQGAIDMAEMALTSAGHEEIRSMANEIITAQQREIDMMNQWLKDWGYTK